VDYSKIVVLKPNVCTDTFSSLNCSFVLFRRLTLSFVVRDRLKSKISSYVGRDVVRSNSAVAVVCTILVRQWSLYNHVHPCALLSTTRGEVGGRSVDEKRRYFQPWDRVCSTDVKNIELRSVNENITRRLVSSRRFGVTVSFRVSDGVGNLRGTNRKDPVRRVSTLWISLYINITRNRFVRGKKCVCVYVFFYYTS